MTDDTRNQTQGQSTEEPDVEGHLNPAIARDIAAVHHQDLHDRADRDRQARSAAGKERDGGMLDKIRRFARRENERSPR